VEAGLRDLSHTWGAQASRKLPRINARQMLQTMNIALGEPNQRAGLICALPFLQQAMLCSLASAKRCLLTSSTGGTLPWEKVDFVLLPIIAHWCSHSRPPLSTGDRPLKPTRLPAAGRDWEW